MEFEKSRMWVDSWESLPRCRRAAVFISESGTIARISEKGALKDDLGSLTVALG
jgi:hypothetical protein